MGYRDEVAIDNPVFHWRLNETSISHGGAAADAEGTVPGIYWNSPVPVASGPIISDAVQRSVRFERSSSDYVYADPQAALDVGDTFSIEFWLKRPSHSGVIEYLMDKASGTPHLRLTTTGALALHKKAGTVNTTNNQLVATSTTTITDTNWHHILVTKSGAAVKMIIDKVDRTPGTIANQTMTNSTGYLYVSSGTLGSEYADTTLADLALYNYVLSPTRGAVHYDTAQLQATPVQAAAAIASKATLTAEGRLRKSSPIVIASKGTLNAAGLLTKQGAAAVAGKGTVASTGVIVRRGEAAIAGKATVTPTSVATKRAAASITAKASVTAHGVATGGVIIKQGAAAIAGKATVSPTAAVVRRGAAAIAGKATITAASRDAVESVFSGAAIKGKATVTPAGVRVLRRGANIAGKGTVTGLGRLSTFTNTSVTFSFPEHEGMLTGIQTFGVFVRKQGNAAGHPSARIELLYGGQLQRIIAPDTQISSAGGVWLTGTWQASELFTPFGVNVEMRVVGTGVLGSTIEVAGNGNLATAPYWRATYEPVPITQNYQHLVLFILARAGDLGEDSLAARIAAMSPELFTATPQERPMLVKVGTPVEDVVLVEPEPGPTPPPPPPAGFLVKIAG